MIKPPRLALPRDPLLGPVHTAHQALTVIAAPEVAAAARIARWRADADHRRAHGDTAGAALLDAAGEACAAALVFLSAANRLSRQVGPHLPMIPDDIAEAVEAVVAAGTVRPDGGAGGVDLGDVELVLMTLPRLCVPAEGDGQRRPETRVRR